MKSYDELIDIMINDCKEEVTMLDKHYEEALGDELPSKIKDVKKKEKLSYIVNAAHAKRSQISILQELKYMYHHQDGYMFEETANKD